LLSHEGKDGFIFAVRFAFGENDQQKGRSLRQFYVGSIMANFAS
jgi:hypothetical protein